MSKDLHAAVLAIQSEIGTLQKNALNKHFGNKYISLDSLVEHVQPLLTKHGLTWMTFPTYMDDGAPALRYELRHVESQTTAPRDGGIGGTMPLLLEKQNAQGLGSAITYARRYALCAVLNIVADVDDDGEKAARAKKPSSDQSEGPAGFDPTDFASRVRGTGMKGTDVRAWLQADGGYSLKDLGPAGQLKDFLNKLPEDKQQKLLAWANG
jgi:hypothetical protein